MLHSSSKRFATLFHNFLPAFFCLVLSVSFSSRAQKAPLSYSTILIDNDSLKSSYEKTSLEFKNKEELITHVKKLSKTINNQGYLGHRIELIKLNDSLFKGMLLLNAKTKEVKLIFNQEVILPTFINNNELITSFDKLNTTINQLYEFYEKNGYTFTEIKLSKISNNSNRLTAQVKILVSKKRHVDKVIVKGYDNFPKKYIKNHLHLSSSTNFNKELIENISKSIKTLNFLTEIRKPEVLFTKDSTHFYIYVKKKKSNKLDGLIGFTNDINGKLQFNGYVDIQLNNSFNKGEQLSILWSNNGNDQKHFKLKVAIPYIFNTPITPEIDFKIYKQDSSFINDNLSLALSYSINRKNILGGSFLSKNSTNLLSNHSNRFIETYSKKLYGISYSFKNRNNTATTFELNTAISMGNKKTETKKLGQYYLMINFLLTKKLTKKSSLYLRNKSEVLEGNNLVKNETFQIGGANTIRGFYEESIFTPAYNFTNFEYRHLTSLESYLYTFTDFGISKDIETNTNNRLYSFGLGYAYKTKGGYINLNYALGKVNKTPFNMNQGIFHIKLTTVF